MNSVWLDFLFGVDTAHISESGLPGGTPLTEQEWIVNPFRLGSYRNFMVMYCSFVDGLDRGIRFPMIYILKTKYMLSQAVAFTAFGVSLTPWLAKPFIALVTDTIPLFGYKRRPYIIGSAVVNAVALGLIGYFCTSQIGGFLVPMSLMTLRTFCRGVTGSVIQGMLIEDCRGPQGIDEPVEQSRTSVLVSQYHTAHRLGQFISVAASGVLLSASHTDAIFVSMAAFHVGSIALTLFLHEEAVSPQDSGSLSDIPEKYDELVEATIDQPEFTALLGYAFLAMANPTYEARMAYYLLDDRHMDVWAVSLVTTAQTVAATITPTIYSVFFQRSNLKPLLKTLTLWTVPASLLPLILTTGISTSLGLDDTIVTAVSGFFLTLTTDLQMMPTNVLVAQLAKPGLEGSSYSVFTVTEGLGRVLSNLYSGIVPVMLGAAAWNNYANMSLYVVVSSVFQLAPLASIKGFTSEIETVDRVMPIPKDSESVITEDEALLSSRGVSA